MGLDLDCLNIRNCASADQNELVELYEVSELTGWQKGRTSKKKVAFALKRVVTSWHDDKEGLFITDSGADRDLLRGVAKKLSALVAQQVWHISVVDSDQLSVVIFEGGEQIGSLEKDLPRNTHALGGNVEALGDRASLEKLLEEKVRFVEEVLERLPLGASLLQDDPQTTKTTFQKALSPALVVDALPRFELKSWHGSIGRSAAFPSFSTAVRNVGRATKGLLVAVSGQAIDDGSLVVSKIELRFGDEKLEIDEKITKTDGDRSVIVFQADSFAIPAGYDCSCFDAFPGNMDAYRSRLEFEYLSVVNVSLYYTAAAKGEFDVFFLPRENPQAGLAGTTIEIE